MAATTRARTGNSKPRVVQAIENVVAPKKTTKANTSKPRTSKVTTGRVAKPKTTTTTTTTTKRTTGAGAGANVKTVKKPRTKTEKVVDKIVGTGEKVVGDVEGKPGKKAAGTRKARGTDSMTKRTTPKTKRAVVA